MRDRDCTFDRRCNRQRGKLLKTGKTFSKVQREALQRAARDGGVKAARRKAAELGLKSVRGLDDLPTAVKELRHVGKPIKGGGDDVIQRGVQGDYQDAERLFEALRGGRTPKPDTRPGVDVVDGDLPGDIHSFNLRKAGQTKYDKPTVEIQMGEGAEKYLKIRFLGQ